MIQEGGQPWTGTIAYPWYTLGLVQAKTPLAGFSLKETMFVDKLSGMLPFLALGALGVANLVAAIRRPAGHAKGRRARRGAFRATVRSARAARAAARGAQGVARRARA